MIDYNIYPKWIDTRKRKRQFKDLSGMKFGRLTVLYRSLDEIMSNGNKTPRYACQCECGDVSLVRATSLKSKHITSCKKCNRKESLKGKNLEDLRGQKFNRWLVLERAESVLEPRGRYATMWKCQCECGVVKNIKASALKANLTFSCGCYKHDILTVKRNLYNQRFGLWKVIGKTPIIKRSKINNRWFYCWLCECQCLSKTKRYVSEQSLVGYKSRSCGCKSEPLLEQYVTRVLEKYNIQYQKQLSFDDLRGVGNGLLSYDFGIYKDDKLICLIECQGKQYFEVCDFFGGELFFQKQLLHDKYKKEYAININVDLFEILYSDRFNVRPKILKILNYYNLTKNNK